MNWHSSENKILLNPRWPEADREWLRTAAERCLAERKLTGHFVLSSSGTTADSWRSVKLIFLSKQAVLNAATSVVKRFGFHSQDVFAMTLPDFHVSGLNVLARAFVSGGRIVEGHEDPAITVLSLVPTQLHDLVREGRRAPPALRCVFLGGGALTPALEKEARALGWPVVASFGMTETSAMIAVREETDPAAGLEILPHMEVRLSDEGLVQVRGASLATGFAKIQNDSTAAWTPLQTHDGWFETEDRARLQNNRLWIEGRGRDFVKIGGESVNLNALREIFSASLQRASLPSTSFHLWARPSERLGHEIVLVAETQGSGDLVQDYNARVLPFERIREIMVMEQIPRTELGKVREEELKKWNNNPVPGAKAPSSSAKNAAAATTAAAPAKTTPKTPKKNSNPN